MKKNSYEFYENIYIRKREAMRIIHHCQRKLGENYSKDETHEQQAFGVVLGKEIGKSFYVSRVIYLKKNYRFEDGISRVMNSMIEKYAIPGELNVEKRAWSINPEELFNILLDLKKGEKFLGTYHMHHKKSWNGDYPKNLPTYLDEVLAKDTAQYNFIVYIDSNDKEKNSIRVFYESKKECEINLIIYDDMEEKNEFDNELLFEC